MILESGTRRTVPAYAATQITLDNLTADALSVRVDGQEPVELGPHKARLFPHELAAQTTVECLGPGSAELSWLIAPEAAENHPDYARLKARSSLSDPQRMAIIEAWKKSFDPASPPAASLPAQLRQFDPTTLADSKNIPAGRSFTTLCPGWDQGSAWGNGDGRIDLTNLVLKNLATAKWAGDPVFSDEDRKVTFAFRVDTLRLDGKCTMIQNCCTGIFGWCWSTSDRSGWNPFEMSMNSTLVRFQSVAVDDPAGLRVDVVDTVLDIQGSRTVRFPGPDWLPDWMTYLTGNWAQIQQFKAATEDASMVALRQPAIRDVMQNVVNNWITAIGTVAERPQAEQSRAAAGRS